MWSRVQSHWLPESPESPGSAALVGLPGRYRPSVAADTASQVSGTDRYSPGRYVVTNPFAPAGEGAAPPGSRT